MSAGELKYSSRVNRSSKNFDSQAEALTWIDEREVTLTGNGRIHEGKTVGDALQEYARVESPKKKGARWEIVRLKKFERNPIADCLLTELSLDDGNDYIQSGLDAGLKPSSITRELSLLKRVLRVAVRWKWLKEYPWNSLEGPGSGKARTRIFSNDEIDAICEKSGFNDCLGTATTRYQMVCIAFLFAIETAMRLGEIVSLERSHVDLKNRTAFLPDTKNGESREVPLSSRAIELLAMLNSDDERYFNATSENVSALFRKIRLLASIEEATFHDTRRLATTRLSKTFDVLELSRITGHKDIQQLQTYYHANAADMAKRLP